MTGTSEFADNLTCQHCFKKNRAPAWPTLGDLTPFFYQTEPGRFQVAVSCPHCRKVWYVVWDSDPGPGCESSDAVPKTPSEPAAATPAPAKIVFACPACGKKLSTAARNAGKKVACPRCDKSVRVPSKVKETAPAEAPPRASAAKAAQPAQPRDLPGLANELRQLAREGPFANPAEAYERMKEITRRIVALEDGGMTTQVVVALRPTVLQLPPGVVYLGIVAGPPREETAEWFVYGLLLGKGFQTSEFIDAIERRYGAALGWWLVEYARDSAQPEGLRGLAGEAGARCAKRSGPTWTLRAAPIRQPINWRQVGIVLGIAIPLAALVGLVLGTLSVRVSREAAQFEGHLAEYGSAWRDADNDLRDFEPARRKPFQRIPKGMTANPDPGLYRRGKVVVLEPAEKNRYAVSSFHFQLSEDLRATEPREVGTVIMRFPPPDRGPYVTLTLFDPASRLAIGSVVFDGPGNDAAVVEFLAQLPVKD